MMFKKVLIANRGEIAVRIMQTCREMGIETVAVYEPADLNSLHVRLADRCVPVESAADFLNPAAMIHVAQETEADAIHPGYGFLAEEASFIRACEGAGIAFIGPPAAVVEAVRDKIGVLQMARAAGFPTVQHSAVSFDEHQFEVLEQAAETLGYPLVVKSCSGGRGAGARLVKSPERLAEMVRRAQAEAQAVYGSKQVYLEKAILPAHQVGVQVVGDGDGRLIHLGDHEGSLQISNRKLLEESPAPCLSPGQRQRLWQTAVKLAQLFPYQNLGTVEFLVDEEGNFYFTEIKARIQVEHPLTEMVTRVDLVQAQIRLAAGEAINWQQADISLPGHAILCRLHAEEPWNHYLPSPGRMRQVRWPGGAEVRVDTYVQSQSHVPATYDPLVAKLTTWAADRATCVKRMRCALEDTRLVGTSTNLPLLQQLVHASEFVAGAYDTEFLAHPFASNDKPETYFRDLAAMAAMMYLRRNQSFQPTRPPRLASGWHQNSRRI
jgi:acetyl/propionyl-CoA carboxylase alpha subunit